MASPYITHYNRLTAKLICVKSTNIAKFCESNLKSVTTRLEHLEQRILQEVRALEAENRELHARLETFRALNVCLTNTVDMLLVKVDDLRLGYKFLQAVTERNREEILSLDQALSPLYHREGSGTPTVASTNINKDVTT
ncbi:hypothetical protein CVT26_000817 [Gymnopilus dilepis]|uniref:Uncharacterized protein n=1 Tax=Gymnopilus dilepis TaxID=231916 RepID=A0A409X3M5_9AGAR|nr:hypothetical protein CVT26_000817 [Gymnopilus dilepis]